MYLNKITGVTAVINYYACNFINFMLLLELIEFNGNCLKKILEI